MTDLHTIWEALVEMARATSLSQRFALGAGLWLLLVNLHSYRAFRADKQASLTGQWRTSEAYLIQITALGGWFGARLAQRRYRHKTSKPSFQAPMRRAGLASAVCYLFLGCLVFGQSPQAQAFDMTQIGPALDTLDATATYIYQHAAHFGAAVWTEFGPHG